MIDYYKANSKVDTRIIQNSNLERYVIRFIQRLLQNVQGILVCHAQSCVQWELYKMADGGWGLPTIGNCQRSGTNFVNYKKTIMIIYFVNYNETIMIIYRLHIVSIISML